MTVRLLPFLVPAALVAAVLETAVARAAAGPPRAPLKWWQKGQSGWVYLDDWTGKYLRGARTVGTTFDVPGKVKAAVIRFWSSRGGELVVNGTTIPRDPNSGPIRDADLTKHIQPGRNTIELRNVGEVVAEGGVVLDDGREVLFATDESWAHGRRVQASRIRREGSRGYMGDYHVARPLAVTTGQKARFAVNQCRLARRRLGDDLQFAFWRHREPAEVLTLAGPTRTRRAWARIGKLLADGQPAVSRAEGLVLAGKCGEALKAVAPAAKKAKQALDNYARLMRTLADGEARRLAAALERAKAGGTWPHVQLNSSKVNRLGWVCSCEPLDNDPAYWEFDLAPPRAGTLGLEGLWWFRTDPKARGRAAGDDVDFAADGLKPIFAPTKWGWERWGYTQANPDAGVNKPYNGLAWYGSRLVVPASWRGADLVLRLGDRWGNNDWLAVNGTWINPPDEDRRGSNAGVFRIPAKLIRFGKPNTLLLRVFNHSNIGGIINPGLRLSVAGREPADLRSPVGPASVRERVYRTPSGDVTQVVYSSALSPAAVVATTGKTLRLHGWAARGFAEPSRIASMRNGKPAVVPVKAGLTIDPTPLGENWLLLWSTTKGRGAPHPLLMVFESRPKSIVWTAGGDADPPGLQLAYDKPGARLAIIRPMADAPAAKPTPAHIERCRLWSRALMRYPVGYVERLAFEGNLCRVRMDYEYVKLTDDWGTKPLALAPLPMLFSYALEHGWPAAKADGEVTDLGCRARSGTYPQMDCGTYRAAVGQTHVTYRFDRMEPKRHLRGVGTLGEERRIGKELVVNLHRWGFNSSRPQIPFHGRGWGLFDASARGGPAPASKVRLAGAGIEFLDEMIGWHRERDMTCILNWFWDFGRGGWSDARGRQIEQFWGAVARRYKDEPKWSVAYSILNEPAGLPWEVYNPFIRRVTKAIRAHDKVHTISIEAGGGWAQPEDLDMTEPTGDENTTYQYHFYGPHKTEFRDNLLYPRYNRSEDRWRSYEGWEERMLSPIRFQIRHRREVFHGEFGISHLQAAGAAEGWLDDVLAIHRKYRMHWNWWNYNGGGTYRTGLVAPDHVNPLLGILRTYARMPAP